MALGKHTIFGGTGRRKEFVCFWWGFGGKGMFVKVVRLYREGGLFCISLVMGVCCKEQLESATADQLQHGCGV